MLDLHVTCEYSFFKLNYGTKPIYCLTCFIEHSESERFQWITVKILGFSRQNTLYRNSEISSYEDFLTLKNIFFIIYYSKWMYCMMLFFISNGKMLILSSIEGSSENHILKEFCTTEMLKNEWEFFFLLKYFRMLDFQKQSNFLLFSSSCNLKYVCTTVHTFIHINL